MLWTLGLNWVTFPLHRSHVVFPAGLHRLLLWISPSFFFLNLQGSTYATMRSDSSETNAFFSWTSWIQCSIISDESPVSGIQKQKKKKMFCWSVWHDCLSSYARSGCFAWNVEKQKLALKDFWFQQNLEWKGRLFMYALGSVSCSYSTASTKQTVLFCSVFLAIWL